MDAPVIKRVGIVGSGIMGAGLAEVAARAGCEVVVRSRTRSSVDAMLDRLAAGLDKQVDKDKLSAGERDEILGRIRTTDHLGELADCDLVIESVIEDIEVKKALFRELERSSTRAPSSPRTPRRSRWSSSQSRPSDRTRSAACTSSTPRP